MGRKAMGRKAILPIAAVLAGIACSELASGRGPDSQRQRATATGAACARGAESMARLELLFGLSRADGSAVSEADWQAFLDAEITPRFQDGLTVLPASGQWREKTGGITRETSRVLLVWYRRDGDSEKRIEAIRAAWKSLQKQQSVMRIDGADCVRF